jgi:hypothetical protein
MTGLVNNLRQIVWIPVAQVGCPPPSLGCGEGGLCARPHTGVAPAMLSITIQEHLAVNTVGPLQSIYPLASVLPSSKS